MLFCSSTRACYWLQDGRVRTFTLSDCRKSFSSNTIPTPAWSIMNSSNFLIQDGLGGPHLKAKRFLDLLENIRLATSVLSGNSRGQQAPRGHPTSRGAWEPCWGFRSVSQPAWSTFDKGLFSTSLEAQHDYQVISFLVNLTSGTRELRMP